MELDYYFKEAIKRNASDLHLVEGSVPSLRIYGELIKMNEAPIPPGELKYAVYREIDKKTRDRFERKRDVDLSMEFWKSWLYLIFLPWIVFSILIWKKPKEVLRLYIIGMKQILYTGPRTYHMHSLIYWIH